MVARATSARFEAQSAGLERVFGNTRFQHPLSPSAQGEWWSAPSDADGEAGAPEWCPSYGMSYTRERLEVFGSGILISSQPQTKTGVIAPSVERRLRTTIGGMRPRRVYYDSSRPAHARF